MHPVSTALFIVGYALSLPIAFRMAAVATGQHRAAFAGHQIGVVVALLGWIITGRIMMAVLHGLWLVGARLWFSLGRNRSETAVG